MIQIENLTKTYNKNIIFQNVNLLLENGNIYFILGKNGSGKTTLMNMLSGIYKPDSGVIKVNSKPVTIHSPEDSKKYGIGMVHQHFKLVEVFSAADNIWMGTEKTYRMKS